MEKDLKQEISHASPPSSSNDQQEEATVTWRVAVVCLAAGLIYHGMVFIVLGTGFWRGTAAVTIGGADVSLAIKCENYRTMNCLQATEGTLWRSGRKWVILSCSFITIVGGIVMATATSMNVFILGSVLAGIGWATIGIIACIPSEVVPRRWRGSIQIALQAFSTCAVPISTIGIAQLVVNDSNGYAGWRWCYWMGTAAVAVGCLLLLFFYNPPPVSGSIRYCYVRNT
ncbi:hypothetical protein RQP46_010617 [Phenoliferia psychrophenolica]